jgi:hypothetical protein
MGNEHSWIQQFGPIKAVVGKHIIASCAIQKWEVKCTDTGLQSIFTSIPGLTKPEVDGLVTLGLETLKKQTSFFRIVHNQTSVGVRSDEFWFTNVKGTMTIQHRKIVATINVDKFKMLQTTRDGELREEQKFPVGLTASEISTLSKFVLDQIVLHFPKSCTTATTTWTCTPPILVQRPHINFLGQLSE